MYSKGSNAGSTLSRYLIGDRGQTNYPSLTCYPNYNPSEYVILCAPNATTVFMFS